MKLHIVSFIAAWGISFATSHAADVTSDRLKIGAGHSLSGTYATIAGGENNTNSVHYGVVSGGWKNTVQSPLGTIGGGYLNIADNWSTVSGLYTSPEVGLGLCRMVLERT